LISIILNVRKTRKKLIKREKKIKQNTHRNRKKMKIGEKRIEKNKK